MVGANSSSFITVFISFRCPSCRPSKLPMANEVGLLTSEGDIKEITINVQFCDFDGKFE